MSFKLFFLCRCARIKGSAVCRMLATGGSARPQRGGAAASPRGAGALSTNPPHGLHAAGHHAKPHRRTLLPACDGPDGPAGAVGRHALLQVDEDGWTETAAPTRAVGEKVESNEFCCLLKLSLTNLSDVFLMTDSADRRAHTNCTWVGEWQTELLAHTEVRVTFLPGLKILFEEFTFNTQAETVPTVNIMYLMLKECLLQCCRNRTFQINIFLYMNVAAKICFNLLKTPTAWQDVCFKHLFKKNSSFGCSLLTYILCKVLLNI